MIYPFINVSAEYSEKAFKEDLYSAYSADNKDIWLYGTGVTALLIATRDATVEPLQDDWGENKPLGELSPIGDYSGQLVPNVIYALYQGYYSEDSESEKKAIHMVKASAFAGMTTFFLKRLFNEKRPHGGDRLSMPSGHTTTAFAFASVIDVYHREWRWPAYALATLVGLSRINDNQHYLHNVTLGATIGMAYGYGLSKTANNSDNLVFLPMNDGALLSYSLKFD